MMFSGVDGIMRSREMKSNIKTASVESGSSCMAVGGDCFCAEGGKKSAAFAFT